MTQENILEIVRHTIAQETEVPLDIIAIDTAIETMNIDSLDVLRIAASLEKTFKIRIETAELIRLRTIGDIVAGLDRKVTA